MNPNFIIFCHFFVQRLGSTSYHAEGRVYKAGSSLRHEFTIKDHLGNARISFSDLNGNGQVDVPAEILQENHYYPGVYPEQGRGGMAQKGPWMNSSAADDSKYLYNGKELNEDFGLGLYDYGARWYDGAVGRFLSVDRFSEKYHPLTPYQYGANNPILFIDVNGDSLNVAQFRDFDAKANDKLLSDLTSQSGLTLTVDENGDVSYSKDSKGKPIVSLDIDGKKAGSGAARKSLIKLINSNDKISVAGTDGLTRTDMDGSNPNLVLINPNQIEASIKNTSKDLNPATFGYGLTFFHELGHTLYGGSGQDPPFDGGNPYEKAGRQEFLPNIIRRQLGSDYGQRLTYTSFYLKTDRKAYFPWGQETLRRLRTGKSPIEKYIIHTNIN